MLLVMNSIRLKFITLNNIQNTNFAKFCQRNLEKCTMKGHCFIEEADKSRSTQGNTHGCWTAMIPENHCNIIVFGKTQCCSNTPPQYCTCHRLPRGRGPQADVGTLLIIIVYFKVLVFPQPWGMFFLESPQYLAKPSKSYGNGIAFI